MSKKKVTGILIILFSILLLITSCLMISEFGMSFEKYDSYKEGIISYNQEVEKHNQEIMNGHYIGSLWEKQELLSYVNRVPSTIGNFLLSFIFIIIALVLPFHYFRKNNLMIAIGSKEKLENKVFNKKKIDPKIHHIVFSELLFALLIAVSAFYIISFKNAHDYYVNQMKTINIGMNNENNKNSFKLVATSFASNNPFETSLLVFAILFIIMAIYIPILFTTRTKELKQKKIFKLTFLAIFVILAIIGSGFGIAGYQTSKYYGDKRDYGLEITNNFHYWVTIVNGKYVYINQPAIGAYNMPCISLLMTCLLALYSIVIATMIIFQELSIEFKFIKLVANEENNLDNKENVVEENVSSNLNKEVIEDIESIEFTIDQQLLNQVNKQKAKNKSK